MKEQQMRRTLLAVLGALMCLLAVEVGSVRAQQDTPTRYVAVTSFEVPFTDRAKVISFLEEYFFPAYQLHPKVQNFRMLSHNWGSNGSQVVLMAEYDTWADIEADCGQPCDDYFAQHKAPEEGDPGYAEYRDKSDTFSKYYAHHTDEIYSTNMNRAVVEGDMAGTVGPPTPADD
jgi:hypothetical protein